jgi:hypothetical protein
MVNCVLLLSITYALGAFKLNLNEKICEYCTCDTLPISVSA